MENEELQGLYEIRKSIEKIDGLDAKIKPKDEYVSYLSRLKHNDSFREKCFENDEKYKTNRINCFHATFPENVFTLFKVIIIAAAVILGLAIVAGISYAKYRLFNYAFVETAGEYTGDMTKRAILYVITLAFMFIEAPLAVGIIKGKYEMEFKDGVKWFFISGGINLVYYVIVIFVTEDKNPNAELWASLIFHLLTTTLAASGYIDYIIAKKLITKKEYDLINKTITSPEFKRATKLDRSLMDDEIAQLEELQAAVKKLKEKKGGWIEYFKSVSEIVPADFLDLQSINELIYAIETRHASNIKDAVPYVMQQRHNKAILDEQQRARMASEEAARYSRVTAEASILAAEAAQRTAAAAERAADNSEYAADYAQQAADAASSLNRRY